jgi:nucleoside-triphosphatase
MNRVVLLTGERGAGKTQLCQRVVSQARQSGYSCAGVLSPAIILRGEKVGLHLADVATGEERLLAEADRAGGEVRWGKYRFVRVTLEWAVELLRRATPCDLLVVDELGPLELKLGQGLVAALDVLEEGAFSLALVVVRPELVDDVRERLRSAEISVLQVDLQSRELLAEQILCLLDQARVQRDLPSGTNRCTMSNRDTGSPTQRA